MNIHLLFYAFLKEQWFWVMTEIQKAAFVVLALSVAAESLAPGFVSLMVSLDLLLTYVVVYTGIYCIIGIYTQQWKKL